MWVKRSEWDALVKRVEKAESVESCDDGYTPPFIADDGTMRGGGYYKAVPVADAIKAILSHLNLRLRAPSKDCTENPARVEKVPEMTITTSGYSQVADKGGGTYVWHSYEGTAQSTPTAKKKKRARRMKER